KCPTCFLGDRVNRLPLGAPILVIHPVALIMPPDEAGANQLGNGAADFCAAGLTNPLANLSVDDPVCRHRIDRKGTLSLKVLSHLVCDRETTGVALSDGNQCVA
ncbi:hypothetical protein, partial [Halomonas sp. ND22Bw]|uniref:hypothetical protein n=1 Tax=Halomonas sp. ND22Bw TaxID=2054178 RepID=UPI001C62EF1C